MWNRRESRPASPGADSLAVALRHRYSELSMAPAAKEERVANEGMREAKNPITVEP
jgi:hypothetical protein